MRTERERRVGAIEVELVAEHLGIEPVRKLRRISEATASSAHEIDLEGVPATCSEPPSATMSSAAASSRCAAIFWPRLNTSVEARKMAEPAVCNDLDPNVPEPRGTRSVSELTSLIWSMGIPSTSEASMANEVW
jgi:hypothetical protein